MVDEAVAVVLNGARPRLQLALGHDLDADYVVLAACNLPPRDLACLAEADPSFYIAAPWAPDAFRSVPSNADVLLVGSGLTAVDMVLRLASRGHTGSIKALSRRGLRPHSYDGHSLIRTVFPIPTTPSLTTLLRDVRVRADADGW